VEMSEIATDLIDYSEFMVREIDGQTINDLKESIKKYGVLQPILVFRNQKTDRWQVICGNHRLCAAKSLGLKTVPIIIKQVNQDEAVFLSLNENIQRLEMNPSREGQIYVELTKKDSYHYSIENLSILLGKSKQYIEGRIRLWEKLRDDLKPHVGKILTLTNALSLSRLSTDEQLEMFAKFYN
jgi:ParB family chromosome partitioning protein